MILRPLVQEMSKRILDFSACLCVCVCVFFMYLELVFTCLFVFQTFLSPRLEDPDLESMQEKKALMVVKRDPLFLRTPPPCQPPVNRTKCIKSVLSVLKLLPFSSLHCIGKNVVDT